jgi:DNA-binding transcriptional ArsR family regulator
MMDIKKLEPEIDLLHEKVCTALGDTTRIMILYLLSEKPLCVNSISEELDIPQPTVSRHLKVLRERDLVNTERQGTNIEYSLADKRIIDALDIMRKILTERIHAQAAITKPSLNIPSST